MDRKRIVRSWWLWAIVAVIAFFVLSSAFSGGDGYKSVKTSVAVAQLKAGNVKTATLNDKSQTLQLELKKAVDGKTKIKTIYADDQTNTGFPGSLPGADNARDTVAVDDCERLDAEYFCRGKQFIAP